MPAIRGDLYGTNLRPICEIAARGINHALVLHFLMALFTHTRVYVFLLAYGESQFGKLISARAKARIALGNRAAEI